MEIIEMNQDSATLILTKSELDAIWDAYYYLITPLKPETLMYNGKVLSKSWYYEYTHNAAFYQDIGYICDKMKG